MKLTKTQIREKQEELVAHASKRERRCEMTFRKALKLIRRNAPETEETFRTICRNRHCNGVRYWSIFDIAKRENLSWESAERRYFRHLKRIHEVFGVSQVGLLWRGDAIAERFRSDIRPFRFHPAKGTKQ